MSMEISPTFTLLCLGLGNDEFSLKYDPRVSCSSSAPISLSDHVLVRVYISQAIVRECRIGIVWQFNQADWQGLQAALSWQDRSFISTSPDVNTA